MLKCFRTGIVVLVLFGTNGGVAAAEPIPVQPVTRSVDTIGCRSDTSPSKYCLHLTSELADMTINSVPNMAATTFTREGFVTGTATAKVTGDDTSSVKKVELKLALQVGCQIDLKTGAQLEIAGTANLGSTLDNAETGAAPVVDFPPADNLNPSATVFPKPGTLTDLQLIDKQIQDPKDLNEIKDSDDNIVFHASVHDSHVSVDGCGGPVSVRIIATSTVSTLYSDENVTAYGDIIQI